jgi:hypothetical protein
MKKLFDYFRKGNSTNITASEVLSILSEIEDSVGGLNTQAYKIRREFESKGKDFWDAVNKEWVVNQKKTLREWVLTTVYHMADAHFNEMGAYIYRGTLSLSGMDAMKLCETCLDMLVDSKLIPKEQSQNMLDGLNEHIKMNG